MTEKLVCIREKLASHIGARVRYRQPKGRRKTEEHEGIIMETYPNIFTLFVKSQNSTVSFRYTDLLTHDVEMELLSSKERIAF
ncbi:MAG TPA: Veg family protein [Acetomicrobium flavidum]|uniref:Veg protein n=2 Tax=Acetomicrobium TaxID=49894 RepID=I4BWE0_ACEMN|nr:Veg family protein [Acetomicrobium mobile]NLG94912.1 hypothetical protein [Acetomicrobium flavidum]AFM21597.1 hypothetical protein Anamo_0972 [Acetomicrobium mobile DSM 13181]SIN62376.1 Uncharacterized protein Veg [Acetomicrobium flavidum]HOJ82916.1 Veg family protein [Acetomicrobium flavidum]HOM31789.1 Veg family protein [Acetomicrobium flavidum]